MGSVELDSVFDTSPYRGGGGGDDDDDDVILSL
jgi:hypothetical protein